MEICKEKHKKKKRNDSEIDNESEDEERKKKRKQKLTSLIHIALSQSEQDFGSKEDYQERKTVREKPANLRRKHKLNSLIQLAVNQSGQDSIPDEDLKKSKKEEDNSKRSKKDEDCLKKRRKKEDYAKKRRKEEDYSKKRKKMDNNMSEEGNKRERLNNLVQLALSKSDIESGSEDERGRNNGDNLMHANQVNCPRKGLKVLSVDSEEEKSEGNNKSRKTLRLSMNSLLHDNYNSNESEDEDNSDINGESCSVVTNAGLVSPHTDSTVYDAEFSEKQRRESMCSPIKQMDELQFLGSANIESPVDVNNKSHVGVNCESQFGVNSEPQFGVSGDTDTSFTKSPSSKKKKAMKKLAVKFDFKKSPKSSGTMESLLDQTQEYEPFQKSKKKKKNKEHSATSENLECPLNRKLTEECLLKHAEGQTENESGDLISKMDPKSSREKSKKSPAKRKRDTHVKLSSMDSEGSDFSDPNEKSQDLKRKKSAAKTSPDQKRKRSQLKDISDQKEKLQSDSVEKMFTDSSDSEAGGDTRRPSVQGIEEALKVIDTAQSPRKRKKIPVIPAQEINTQPVQHVVRGHRIFDSGQGNRGDDMEAFDSGMGSDGDVTGGSNSNRTSKKANVGHSKERNVKPSDIVVQSPVRRDGDLIGGSVASFDSTIGVVISDVEVMDKDGRSSSTRTSLEGEVTLASLDRKGIHRARKKKERRTKRLLSFSSSESDNEDLSEDRMKQTDQSKIMTVQNLISSTNQQESDLIVEGDTGSETLSQRKSEKKKKKKKEKKKKKRKDSKEVTEEPSLSQNLCNEDETSDKDVEESRRSIYRNTKGTEDEDLSTILQLGNFKCTDADLKVSDEVCGVIHASNTLDSHMEKKNYMYLLRNGYQVRRGLWAPEEEKLLLMNWAAYIQDHPNVEKSESLLDHVKHDKESKKFLKETNFYRRLSKNLNRLTCACFRKAQTLLIGHRLHQVEDTDVRKIMDKLRRGQSLKQVAREHRVNVESIRAMDKAANKPDISTKKWSHDEDCQLLSSIKQKLGVTDIDENTNITRLPWKEIAHNVPSRTAVQCRHHFQQCLYPRLLTDTKLKWKIEDANDLRKTILSQEPKQSSQIRWDEVREVMGSHFTVSILKLRWNRMVRHVPYHKQMSFVSLCQNVKKLDLQAVKNL